MIYIAICDDDQTIVDSLDKSIRNWIDTKKPKESVSIRTFTSSTQLESELQSGIKFNLFFLDIEMPGKSGFELSKAIREKESRSIIIFVTSHLDFAIDGYKYEALRYIFKGTISEELPEALDTACDKISKLTSEKLLAVPLYNNYVWLSYDDIVYVHHVIRDTQIFTSDQKVYKDHRGLNELFKVIDDERFLFTDRSTFINMNYVRQIKGNEIILKSGEKVAISRPMISKVKAGLSDYLGR